ncbi:MAG TPA: prolipoprotein diacylglyceryl transferase [Lachnospiraceae bacterium]|jgi:phosphatidylglycerol---prolipoprotein diacylglyceryl transferase|nr:prolipoprotein diacylglyceryl transferase [Lachnospiraceae bacterium]
MPQIMNTMDIAFPNLGIYLNNVPKSFSIFGFEIALYGITMATAILMGILMGTHEAKRTNQNPDDYWDMVMYAIVFAFVGARIYYVAFSWDYYKDNLLSIFNLREGGIALYGSLIGAFLTLFVYTRVKKKSFFLMADTGILGVLVGQIIGRWGNFFNREAFGGYTDSVLAMRLPLEMVRRQDISEDIAAHMIEGTNYIQVHPTFLYEGLWNCFVLLGILLYKKHKKFDGEMLLLYLEGYGVGRFLIEGLRTDQLLIPGIGIAISQVIGLTTAVVAVIAIICFRVKMSRQTE